MHGSHLMYLTFSFLQIIPVLQYVFSVVYFCSASLPILLYAFPSFTGVRRLRTTLLRFSGCNFVLPMRCTSKKFGRRGWRDTCPLTVGTPHIQAPAMWIFAGVGLHIWPPLLVPSFGTVGQFNLAIVSWSFLLFSGW